MIPLVLAVAATLVLQGNAGSRTDQAAQAEQALRRGDRSEARKLALAVTQPYEQNGRSWSSSDCVAAARAYVVLGADNAQDLRRAVAAFDAAIAADSSNLDARLRLGDLFLAKYNAPDAREAYQSVLKLAPNHPAALLGEAQVLAFEGRPAVEPARRALAGNPALVGAHLLLARSHFDAEALDSAVLAAGRALALDSSAISAWALLGAAAWVRGDSAGLSRAAAAARRYQRRPAGFYADLAEAAARYRRYADAVRFASEGVALDSLSAPALSALGVNELRTGAMADGRAHLERAFALDPFHVWNKNTLDLLDQLRTFRTTRHGRFELVTPPRETDLLTMYLAPLLTEAHDKLAARYGYTPPQPIRLEVFDRHADFSVRTVGLAGLGALGVSFGSVLAMDAPSARRPGEFNWGSTAWHELAHTFTLGMSDHRVPRWLSEGLSVLEERRARPGWGADASLDFLSALSEGRVRPVSSLNEGFVRPTYPTEVQVSYYVASLVCEMIETERGAAALPALLVAFRDGLDTPSALRRALGMTPDALDQQFAAWLRNRFPRAGATKQFVEAMTTGMEHQGRGRSDAARAAFVRAQQILPEYAGEDGPAWQLAQLARGAGDLRGAAAQLARITSRNETALAANRLEAEVLEELGNPGGAIAALERMIWIVPYDAATHRRLAELAARTGDHARAVRERRAIVALQPTDLLEARYQLAQALLQSGDRAAARREVMAVLEQAPGFEKAQLLFLELRGQP